MWLGGVILLLDNHRSAQPQRWHRSSVLVCKHWPHWKANGLLYCLVPEEVYLADSSAKIVYLKCDTFDVFLCSCGVREKKRGGIL